MKFIYKWLIALLLAIEPSLMWSDDNLPSDMRLGAESMPLASAFDCVNLITGDFFLTDTSVTLEGPCPLHYSRFYDSGLYYSNHRGFGNGIHLPLRLGHMNRLMRDDKEVMLIVEEREAATVAYFGRNYGEVIQAQVDPKVFAIGYKNYSETGIAGVDSIKNKQLRFTGCELGGPTDRWGYTGGQCEMTLGSGTVRNYYWHRQSVNHAGFWTLHNETKPNSHKLHFTQNIPGRLIQVKSTNSAGTVTYNSVDVIEQPNGYWVKGSNGQNVFYATPKCRVKLRHKKAAYEPFITHIIPSYGPMTTLQYHYKRDKADGLWLKLYQVTKPDGRFLNIDYNVRDGKVIALRAPLGADAKPVTMASFAYYNETTDVFNALQHKTTYWISPEKRVTAIDCFQEQAVM